MSFCSVAELTLGIVTTSDSQFTIGLKCEEWLVSLQRSCYVLDHSVQFSGMLGNSLNFFITCPSFGTSANLSCWRRYLEGWFVHFGRSYVSHKLISALLPWTSLHRITCVLTGEQQEKLEVAADLLCSWSSIGFLLPLFTCDFSPTMDLNLELNSSLPSDGFKSNYDLATYRAYIYFHLTCHNLTRSRDLLLFFCISSVSVG